LKWFVADHLGYIKAQDKH